MKNLAKYKGSLATIAIVILLVIFYRMLFGNAVDLSQSASAQGVGKDLIELSATLQRVTLDDKIFSSNLYRALVDFSTVLSPQPTGRTNPFDIIGRD